MVVKPIPDDYPRVTTHLVVVDAVLHQPEIAGGEQPADPEHQVVEVPPSLRLQVVERPDVVLDQVRDGAGDRKPAEEAQR